ncbi:hypothetical protein M1247_26755 [Mycobacterium sp. 21AC1]|uniref:hypothetical protein n=1 Tax=[Mycobacterium] appelbergii TaxID=2939269 RepID=UPI002938F97A|nr:hypothetical protein [Mycobacterium sp. 21AC1]MDV3128535.1 hypothetical protein [Mycobacterium sp. 21AC1]
MTDPDDGTAAPDDTLPPSEATDSEEVAPKADGDEVVDPPQEWHGADKTDKPDGSESLDEKLGAEVPDRPAQGPPDDDGSFYSVVD